MSLDIWILAAITICQGATGYWAFHMSVNDKKARWGFAGLTLLSICLLVWSGVRSSRSSDNVDSDLNGIQQTLSHIVSSPSSNKESHDQFIGPLEEFYVDGVNIKSKIMASEPQYSETQINGMWVWQVNVANWVCNNMGAYALAKLSDIPENLTPSSIGATAQARSAVTLMTVSLNNLNDLILSDTWDPHGPPHYPASGCASYVAKATDAPFSGAN